MNATHRARAAWLALLLIPLAPLIALYLINRLLLRRKGLPGWRDKLRGAAPEHIRGGIVIHGVSLGEVNLMPALVAPLEAATGARCLLTTSTATGRERLDTLFPQHARGYLPLDLPWAVERFLRTTQPRALVLLELELWPQLLARCHARGIPVLLVNARVGDGSFRGWQRSGAIGRTLLAPLRLALAQNGTWAARLRALGARSARASGSLKADMVRPAEPAAAEALAARLGLDPTRPLLLIASTSAGGSAEEQVALSEGVTAWAARGWQVALCPRHPERAEAVAALIAAAGGAARRASRGERCGAPTDVALIDEIGRLSALYAWCARTQGIAVVGGSFGSGRGGQNMLEPAAAGCAVVVGPDTRNFPDAMALLRLRDAIVEAAPADMAGVLARLATDAPRRAALGMAARAAWLAGRGAGRAHGAGHDTGHRMRWLCCCWLTLAAGEPPEPAVPDLTLLWRGSSLVVDASVTLRGGAVAVAVEAVHQGEHDPHRPLTTSLPACVDRLPEAGSRMPVLLFLQSNDASADHALLVASVLLTREPGGVRLLAQRTDALLPLGTPEAPYDVARLRADMQRAQERLAAVDRAVLMHDRAAALALFTAGPAWRPSAPWLTIDDGCADRLARHVLADALNPDETWALLRHLGPRWPTAGGWGLAETFRVAAEQDALVTRLMDPATTVDDIVLIARILENVIAQPRPHREPAESRKSDAVVPIHSFDDAAAEEIDWDAHPRRRGAVLPAVAPDVRQRRTHCSRALALRLAAATDTAERQALMRAWMRLPPAETFAFGKQHVWDAEGLDWLRARTSDPAWAALRDDIRALRRISEAYRLYEDEHDDRCYVVAEPLPAPPGEIPRFRAWFLDPDAWRDWVQMPILTAESLHGDPPREAVADAAALAAWRDFDALQTRNRPDQRCWQSLPCANHFDPPLASGRWRVQLSATTTSGPVWRSATAEVTVP